MFTGKRASRALFLTVGLLVASFALAACSSDDPTATPVPATGGTAPTATPVPDTGGTAPIAEPPAPAARFKYGGIANFSSRTDPPRGWDPIRSGSISVLQAAGSLFGMGNMIRQCPLDGASICAGTADSWSKNADGTVWTFKIKDNVFWHDGVQFTAADAKFWLDLAVFGVEVDGNVRRKASWNFTPFVESVAAPDASTVVITLKSAVFDFDFLLAIDNQINAHPRHLMQPEIDKGNVNVSPLDVGLIGTGPFMLESYQPGSVAKMRRFDKYYLSDERGNQLPYLDGIDYYITPDPSGMDTAFRTGRLDATARGTGFQLTPERENAILSTLGPDKVQIMKMAQSSFWALAFNSLRDGPLQDVNVRRAINLWLDRAALVKVTFGGFGRPTGMFDPQTAWAIPGILEKPGWNQATKEADRAQAKTMLAAAGYPDGFDTDFTCRRQWTFVCEPLVGQLEALGISVSLDLLDDATLAQAGLDANYDMRLSGPTLALPSQYASILSTHATSPTSNPKHNDTKVNDFFVRLAAADSVAERFDIAHEMEQYIAIDQVYSASLYTEEAHSVVREYVKGVQVPVDNYRRNLDFATVWLDK